MKYTLSKLIEVIDSKNPNWTEERIAWFIDSIKEEGTNYNALTRSDRKMISGLSDSRLEAYVGSLLGEQILDNTNNSARQIVSEAQQIRFEADRTIEQLLNEANVEAQQIRDDAHTESREYLSGLNAARIVELYTKELPAEGTLRIMPKAGLLDYAQIIGCDVNDEMIKQDIVDTISNNYSGLEKDVIVVPDRSEQIKFINRQKSKLGILENDLDAREEKCIDLESELQEREETIESEEQRVKLARFYGRMYWLIGGATLAGAAAYGEYTGITDFVDFTNLRG